jgi:legumain
VQVKSRTSNHNTYKTGSHVLEFGDLKINTEELDWYLGFDPANENVTGPIVPRDNFANSLGDPKERHVLQRDADLVHYWHRVSSTVFFSVSLKCKKFTCMQI